MRFARHHDDPRETASRRFRVPSFLVHGSQFTVHSSQFTVHSWDLIQPPTGFSSLYFKLFGTLRHLECRYSVPPTRGPRGPPRGLTGRLASNTLLEPSRASTAAPAPRGPGSDPFRRGVCGWRPDPPRETGLQDGQDGRVGRGCGPVEGAPAPR